MFRKREIRRKDKELEKIRKYTINEEIGLMIKESKRILREIDKKKRWGKKSLEVPGMKNVKRKKRN